MDAGSSNGLTSLLDGVLNAQTTQPEIGVSVRKRAQDATLLFGLPCGSIPACFSP